MAMGKLRFSDIAGTAMVIFSLCISEVNFIAGLVFLLISFGYVAKAIVLKPQWKKTIVKSITFGK